MPLQSNWKDFILRIILPTLLAFCLFTISIFSIIIPEFEENILDRKREMISELTNSAWSVFEEFEQLEQDSVLTRLEAQKEALTRIEYLRYGDDRKDYFWITDKHPIMIMHPYREELNGTDLSDYQDPTGKKLFVEFVSIVKDSGSGFVDYMWQWKDDSTKIVPKLSYVKSFEPWDWIIGTGIYIEDVAEEIARLEQRLIYISFGILLILGFILAFVTQQSLKIEKEKRDAEKGLKESEVKYRTLVEASTEGLVMILDGEFVYANQVLYDQLGYKNFESNLSEILCGVEKEKISGQDHFKNLLKGKFERDQIEARLKTIEGKLIDVLLFTSEITFGEKSGYTVIIKDLSKTKEISDQLDESQEKFNTLTNIINIGVFRTTVGRKGKIIEANNAVLELLGYNSKEELFEISIFDLFREAEDRNAFIKNITETGSIKNSIVQITRGDGSASMLSVSAVLIKDEDGNQSYCDGIIEDVTARIKLNEERENLITELQSSLHFLNQPIKLFAKEIISCNMNKPVAIAAKLMSKKKYSALLVTSDSEEFVGIITDRDIRDRVAADGYETSKPIFGIMTSPIITISSNSLIFEALLLMQNKSTRHLAVKDSHGKIFATISSEELLHIQRGSTTYLMREISGAESKEELRESHEKLPLIIKTLVNNGAKTKNITKIISSVSDSVVKRVIELTINEIGLPPAPFTFIAFGSEGREEQTLITDQDNAIIYGDNHDESINPYFLKLGEKVCNQLDYIGYSFCKGNNMAKNPEWVKPFSAWKEKFSSWIINSTPDDLLRLGIFFDFRSVYGNETLCIELRNHVLATAKNKAAFFQHLTLNCLQHKPPVGLLGNIVTKSSGEHPETFDIKKALMPVTEFARIYSLKNSIRNTNTLERLQLLFENNLLKRSTYQELTLAYNFLMQLRFKHQITEISENKVADNFVNPEELTQIEQTTLKNTFSQISSIQKSLSFEFTGEAI